MSISVIFLLTNSSCTKSIFLSNNLGANSQQTCVRVQQQQQNGILEQWKANRSICLIWSINLSNHVRMQTALRYCISYFFYLRMFLMNVYSAFTCENGRRGRKTVLHACRACETVRDGKFYDCHPFGYYEIYSCMHAYVYM